MCINYDKLYLSGIRLNFTHNYVLLLLRDSEIHIGNLLYLSCRAGQVYFEKPKTVDAVLSASNNDLTFRGQVLRVSVDYSQPYRPDTSNRLQLLFCLMLL